MPADYMTTESRLPFSLEAEQSVLGAALLDSGCVPDLVRLVRPEYFYREQHRLIFEVISAKFTLGEPIDIVTVMETAVREEIFSTPEETKTYLAQLAQIVPSVHNLEAYTNILREKYHLRTLITTSRDIIEQAEAPTAESDGLLDYAEQKIYDIRNGHNNDSLVPVSRVVLETFDHLQRLSGENRADYLGISTGYSDLDRTITGLNKSDLILVAARPGMGKTSLALNIALHVGKTSGKTVAVFSLEMAREQLTTRLLAGEGLVDSQKLLTGKLSADEWRRVGAAATTISATDIRIDDNPSLSVADMNAQCRRIPNLGLVVIDYLQLMQSAGSGHGWSNESRTQAVSDMSRMLKIMAKELNVPVICLSQLSRANEARQNKRPMLSDLRESGAIEQDADIVMFLYRDDYYNSDSEKRNIAECIVAKNRHGETGKVELRWLPEYTSFGTLENRYQEEN